MMSIKLAFHRNYQEVSHLILLFISLCAENPYSPSHDDADVKIILTTFKLILG